MVVVITVSGFFVFSIKRAVNRQVNSFKTLKIILDDEGIERKADMQPYKRIAWRNLQLKERKNGGLYLYDRSISVYNRKMYGYGVIYIYPEIGNREMLLNSIRLKLAGDI